MSVADHPEGPFVKSPLNPIANSGHRIWVWPWRNGIVAIADWAGPEKDTVQYSEDGVNSDVVASLADIPPAGGAYIQGQIRRSQRRSRLTWGQYHYGMSDWNSALRFECDLHRDSETTAVEVLQALQHGPRRDGRPRSFQRSAGSFET